MLVRMMDAIRQPVVPIPQLTVMMAWCAPPMDVMQLRAALTFKFPVAWILVQMSIAMTTMPAPMTTAPVELASIQP